MDDYTRTYTTFSGHNIVLQNFDGVKVADLDGITWSVTREMAPVFTMDKERFFKRGRRSYAGTFIAKTHVDTSKAPFDVKITGIMDTAGGNNNERWLYGVENIEFDSSDDGQYLYSYLAREVGPVIPKDKNNDEQI